MSKELEALEHIYYGSQGYGETDKYYKYLKEFLEAIDKKRCGANVEKVIIDEFVPSKELEKEYLEALKRLKENSYYVDDKHMEEDVSILEKALKRLEAIDNANSSDPIKYDEKANEENMKLFKKWGFRNSDEIYKCVLCGCQTCLSDSTSIMGYKLICNTCAYNTFAGHYGDARKWQQHCSVKLALNSLYGECRGDDE